MISKNDNKNSPDNISSSTVSTSTNFIQQIILDDLESDKHQGKVVTRFPPEPNGYLHIGHAKAICINFGLANEFHGRCHLRMDDTNPCKEDVEYIDSIKEDVRWLGFEWGEHEYYASDYYDRLYDFAVQLIKLGKAYVDSLSAEELREHRGTLTQGGRAGRYRERSIEENLDLFTRMKNGEFEDGSHVLRAKIDMNSPNLNMRDPVIYRIRKVSHHRTGDKWCIYPMYDFTHCLSDMLEGITHSICTLEFEDHRPLYDWFLDELKTPCHPQQIEFARLNLSYTMMSKRRLLELVQEKVVSGWDDPRMPTLSGFRRRGYTPSAIRTFCERIGVAKANSTVDYALLEFCIREELNQKATRVMAVLKPLKVVITNYPEGQVEELDAENNSEDPSMGSRKIPFSREIYIEEDDFSENPPPKYFRLSPGKEMRLKHAYYIKCDEVIKDPSSGKILELHCTYDPTTKGGWSADGRKVMGTAHWVNVGTAIDGIVRLYNQLFTAEHPGVGADGEEVDYRSQVNPNSVEEITSCKFEPSLAQATAEQRYQFLRQGYFCLDRCCQQRSPVFNRIVTLKDSWAGGGRGKKK
ncbi:MAG: glutamine--tRNA ligase/YqeY domain fusion protein [Oligoflexia bacterium]|nr:glutamine--tRNA ligase/YqeY domain fusion protein [Oligoflexia bacterium]